MVDWWFILGIIIGVAFVLLVWAGLHIVYLENYIQEYQSACENYQTACNNTIALCENTIDKCEDYSFILQYNLSKIQSKYSTLKEKYILLNEKYSQLKKQNDNLNSQKGLINPTYEQLWDFVITDKTNNLEWEENFDCTEFSNRFIKNFAERGFYSCTTELTFDDDTGHIIVAVKTDRGIYYIEPQTDYLIRNDELRVGKDYCDIVDWDCDWKIRKISSCFKLKV